MLGRFKLDTSRRWFLSALAGAGAGLSGWRPSSAASGGSLPSSTLSASREKRGDGGSSPHVATPTVDRHEIRSAVRRSTAHLLAKGVDDILTFPFEIERLRQDSDLRECVERLVRDRIENSKQPTISDGAVHRITTPKSSGYGYRQCAHIEIIGSIHYLALAILVAEALEPFRRSAANNRILSHRFVSDGVLLFDPRYFFANFQTHVLERLDPATETVVVTADIVDFFANIDFVRLSQNLLDCGVEEWLVAATGSLLAVWSKTLGNGLPIGSNASCILGEAALVAVDRTLLAEGIDFVRFVDDYRLFAPNTATARRWLARLVEILANDGFMLNHEKTSILCVTRADYQHRLRSQEAAVSWGSQASRVISLHLAEATPEKKKKTPGSDRPQPTPRPPTPALPDDDDPYRRRRPPRKSELNEHAVLAASDPSDLAAHLQRVAAEGAHVLLGDFRFVVEASIAREEFIHFFDMFEILDHCPHCIPYLVDVLIESEPEIPDTVKRRATGWFSARLESGACLDEYEMLQVARLLGTDPYASPKAIHSALLAGGYLRRPVAARALLSALHGRCDEPVATTLLNHCPDVDAVTRRAVVDLVWPALTPDKKAIALTKLRNDFVRDPFLVRLAESCDLARQET